MLLATLAALVLVIAPRLLGHPHIARPNHRTTAGSKCSRPLVVFRLARCTLLLAPSRDIEISTPDDRHCLGTRRSGRVEVQCLAPSDSLAATPAAAETDTTGLGNEWSSPRLSNNQ